MAYRESVWDHIETRQNRPGEIGYDYRGKILQNTISPMFYAESKRAGILLKMEDIFTEMVESVKILRRFMNWNIPKNYRDFN